MKKLYTCRQAGSFYINGRNTSVAYGADALLSETEATKYASFFTLSTAWNRIFNAQVITTTGGAITRSKTFEEASSNVRKSQEVVLTNGARGQLLFDELTSLKLLTITATVVGTMPAGAIATLDVYDENGNIVETKYEKFGSVINTSASVYFTGSYLNEADSYKVTLVVPQANPANYTLTVTSTETVTEDIKNVKVTASSMISGVNQVELTGYDVDGDAVPQGAIVDVLVCANALGTPAANTILNGIAEGTEGKIIEFIDDVYVKAITGANGKINLALTPANAGTPTESVLTIKGIPAVGDTFKLGNDTYEFETVEANVTAGNIWVDISTCTNQDDVASQVEADINASSQYDVTAVDTAGTPTETELVFAVGAPSTGDTVTFGTEVYEFTTDGATPLTLPTNIRISIADYTITDHITAGQAFKTVFNANTAYNVTATGAGATITITANDLYTLYNSLSTVATITGPSTGAFPAVTFGDGAGASTTGVDAKVTVTANNYFVAYNTLPTTDPIDTNSYLGWADTTFGGGNGASTPGVDLTSFYYLAVKYGDKQFITKRLPYQA